MKPKPPPPPPPAPTHIGDRVTATIMSGVRADMLDDIGDARRAVEDGIRTMEGDLRRLPVVVAERDRLARVLAVERGDQTLAPPGWAWVDGAWVGPGLVRVVRRNDGDWAWWDGCARRKWPTALEAMEAIDAEEVTRG